MFANPNFYLVLNERDDPKKRMRGTLNTYADVKIIDGLKYRISANADLGSDQTESWVPSIAMVPCSLLLLNRLSVLMVPVNM